MRGLFHLKSIQSYERFISVKSEPPAEEGEQLMIKNEDVKTEPVQEEEESIEPVKKKKKSKKSKKEPVEVKTEPVEEETVAEEEKIEALGS